MSEVSHNTDGSEDAPQEIPVDQMPSILETVAPPPEHQYQHPESSQPKRNKLRLAIAGGLVAVGAGIGALVAGGGSEGNDREIISDETADTSPEVSTPTTAITVATTEATLPPTTEETLPPEFAIQPVLMTASTPEGLMDEFIDNVYCMLDDYPMELQNKCLEYAMAGQGGNLTDAYRSNILAMNGYRKDNPGFEFFFDANVVEYEMGENTARIVADVEDAAGTRRQLYTFRKFPFTVDGSGLEDGSGGTVWGLTEEETLSPGEITFG